MNEKPTTGRESHFFSCCTRPTRCCHTHKSAMLGAETGLPNVCHKTPNKAEHPWKKPFTLQQSSVKAPPSQIDFRLGVDAQGVFQEDSLGGVPPEWYFRNKSSMTHCCLSSTEEKKMKKFAIPICVNRKICDNLELEKNVVLRKRITPFIFSSLRIPFGP